MRSHSGSEATSAGETTRVLDVMSRGEVRAMLSHLEGLPWIAALLAYGAGLRLAECLRLRVGDLDFGYRRITVQAGDGRPSRFTVLPWAVEVHLREHLGEWRAIHAQDLARGAGYVRLPAGTARHITRNGRAWGWQWVFPALSPWLDRDTGRLIRHHLPPAPIRMAIRRAAWEAGLSRRVTCRTLRRSRAVHLLQEGHDPAMVRALLGQADPVPPGLIERSLERLGQRGGKVYTSTDAQNSPFLTAIEEDRRNRHVGSEDERDTRHPQDGSPAGGCR